jgi:hypothetical protein
VHDHALEAREQPAPEVLFGGRAAREQVVGRQDERRAVAQQADVELRRREPLQVDDVGTRSREAGQSHRMLERLQRQPQPRAPKQP